MILKDIYLSWIRERARALFLIRRIHSSTEEVLGTPIVCLCERHSANVKWKFTDKMHSNATGVREAVNDVTVQRSLKARLEWQVDSSWQNFRFASAMHFEMILFFAPLKKTRLTSCFAIRLERKSVVFTYCVQLQLCHRSCLYAVHILTFRVSRLFVYAVFARASALTMHVIYLLSSLAMGNDEYNSREWCVWSNKKKKRWLV